MFFVQHHCFWFQKTQVEKHQFLVKEGGCNITGVKSYRFLGGLFWANCWLLFKKHYKIRHFSTFFKATNYKKGILNVIIWSKLIVIIWSKLSASEKNANLDQIITFKYLARNFL